MARNDHGDRGWLKLPSITEVRATVIIVPSDKQPGWWWCAFRGDGSTPGDALRGAGTATLVQCLREALEWAERREAEKDATAVPLTTKGGQSDG